MNKIKLVESIILKLKLDWELLSQAALATYQGAIHADSRAEDKYDTRGLEASYLAGAQSKRLAELEDLIRVFQFTDLKVFSPGERISSTALVELQTEGKVQTFFLMPKGGGLQVMFENKMVQVLTPQSPLGESMLGKKVGDEFEVRIQGKFRDYVIQNIY